MAEGLLRKLAKERGIHVEVRSAGVSAVPGTSISRHAGGILQDEGIQDRIVSSQLDGRRWPGLI